MNLDNVTTKAILRLEQVSLFTKLSTQTKENLPGYTILEDISFEIFPGDRIGIVGVSGAGKTYLLRLLNRLSEPSNGKIYLENQNYNQIPVVQLRQQVMLVAQEPKLLSMTVKEALTYPLVLQGLGKQEVNQRLVTWTEQLGIPDDWLERTEVQLSLGQRQLVSIARGLITQPKILLLDEPTSALDIGTFERIMSVLNKLTQNQKTTIVMVNHDLEVQKKFCTQLLHLQQGRLVANQKAAAVNWSALTEKLKQAAAQQEEDFGF